MENVFDICSFGAVGDGKTNCTAPINRAISQAARTKGVVVVPPGTYLSGTIKMYPGVTLKGFPAWSFRRNGSSVIVLRNAEEHCLIDITGAVGCTIDGICLDGGNLGSKIHGINLQWEEYDGAGEEDSPVIEDCRIFHFSGDGIHLEHAWCFSIRHSMTGYNGMNGIYLNGWDGFLLDNWLSFNCGAGLCGDVCAAALTITGNRVEWNKKAGFYLRNAEKITITGNYFDRGGTGIDLAGTEVKPSSNISILGNFFNGCGRGVSEWQTEPYFSSHILLQNAENVSMVGNIMNAGLDDLSGEDVSPHLKKVLKDLNTYIVTNSAIRGFGSQEYSPDYGVVFKKLKNCVFKDNVMSSASVKSNIANMGCHKGTVIIKDNPGEPMKQD